MANPTTLDRDVSERGFRLVMITLGIIAATLMQTLDTTIVNVALPTIQGNLGASSRPEVVPKATSFQALSLQLGGSFSTAALITLLARRDAFHSRSSRNRRRPRIRRCKSSRSRRTTPQVRSGSSTSRSSRKPA
jgi:hypothetical protein